VPFLITDVGLTGGSPATKRTRYEPFVTAPVAQMCYTRRLGFAANSYSNLPPTAIGNSSPLTALLQISLQLKLATPNTDRWILCPYVDGNRVTALCGKPLSGSCSFPTCEDFEESALLLKALPITPHQFLAQLSSSRVAGNF